MDFLSNMMMEQQMMQEQNEMMQLEMMNQAQMAQQQMLMQNQQLVNQVIHTKKTTRKDVMEYLQMLSGSKDIIQVDEFETQRTRHICRGTKEIKLIDKGVQPVQTSEGVLMVDFFLCPECKRLILNKSTITI